MTSDFEKAKAAYESLTPSDRAVISNERLEAEGSPWRVVVSLPHDRLGPGLANGSIRIVPVQELRLHATQGTIFFFCLMLIYLVAPVVASIFFAIHLKQPLVLITLLLQFVAIAFAGVPASGFWRYLLVIATIILGFVRGLEDLLTLLVGIPALAAVLYRYSDNFKNQEYIREVIADEELFNNEVGDGSILIEIDTRRFE
jgi:hypothetical protein